MVNSEAERLSFAFFYNPKGDLQIKPVLELVTPDRPALYEPMTFDEYRLYIRKKGPRGKSQVESLKAVWWYLNLIPFLPILLYSYLYIIAISKSLCKSHWARHGSLSTTSPSLFLSHTRKIIKNCSRFHCIPIYMINGTRQYLCWVSERERERLNVGLPRCISDDGGWAQIGPRVMRAW